MYPVHHTDFIDSKLKHTACAWHLSDQPAKKVFAANLWHIILLQAKSDLGNIAAGAVQWQDELCGFSE